MNFLNTWLPLISAAVSFSFAFLVLKRYAARRGPHLLLWGIGMLFYGIGGLMEGLYGLLGWSGFVFKTWYLFGAVLVAAWLGQGTVYLLVKPIKRAHVAMALLLVASIAAGVYVYTLGIQAPVETLSELSGKAVYPSPGEAFSPRTITPFFNTYGTLGLVGGAVYSAWIFFRKRVLLHRVIGNVLIAVGGLSPAVGGSMSRLGIEGALYISELLGAVIMFAGFIRATTEMKQPETESAPAAAD